MILKSDGHEFSDCTILGFRFKTIRQAYAFHFGIMDEHLPYLLFDGATEKTRVIVSKDTPEEPFVRIASKYDGEFYKPQAYNDYE